MVTLHKNKNDGKSKIVMLANYIKWGSYFCEILSHDEMTTKQETYKLIICIIKLHI